MAQDVIKGRPTEIEYMNGHVATEGQERGVKTPVSSAVIETMREVEAGKRAPSPANIEASLKRAGV